MNNRVQLFDIARAICVLEIVGLWHMFDYIPKVSWSSNFIEPTLVVLATFTFLSGLFLGKKKQSIGTFYFNRIKRFYLLLVLSLLSFYLGGQIGSIKQLLFAATGISCFVLPQPMTLWYFSMMIVFYLLTPLILLDTYTNDGSIKYQRIIIRGLLIELIMFVISCLFSIDERILLYFPFYLLGIITPIDKVTTLINLRLKTFTIGISLIIVGLLFSIGWFKDLLTMGGGMLILLFLSSLLESHLYSTVKRILLLVSYSSMCAYLFHRQVYYVLRYLTGNEEYVPYGMIPIMIIVLFIVSFCIQKVYDSILKCLQ